MSRYLCSNNRGWRINGSIQNFRSVITICQKNRSIFFYEELLMSWAIANASVHPSKSTSETSHWHAMTAPFFSFVRIQFQSRSEPLSFVTPRDESDRIPGCWKKWTVTDKMYGEIRASYIVLRRPSFLPHCLPYTSDTQHSYLLLTWCDNEVCVARYYGKSDSLEWSRYRGVIAIEKHQRGIYVQCPLQRCNHALSWVALSPMSWECNNAPQWT